MTTPSIKEALIDLISLCERNLYPQPDKPNSDWAKVQAAKAALATLQPSGERRDAIARALAEKWPGDYMQGDDECDREPNALAYETADAAIIASVLVQDEAAIRADELEKLLGVVTDKLKDETSERYAKGWNNALISVCAAIRAARDGGGS